jgi:hypothetical protein
MDNIGIGFWPERRDLRGLLSVFIVLGKVILTATILTYSAYNIVIMQDYAKGTA